MVVGMSELARVGGTVGALGLALLFVGSSRSWRLGGLGALGRRLRSPSRSSSRRPATTALFAAAAVVGVDRRGRPRVAFVRVPWLLAVPSSPARRRGSPSRSDRASGRRTSSLPMYVVVAAAAIALALGVLRRGRSDA